MSDSEQDTQATPEAATESNANPVRKWTIILIIFSLLLLAWYIAADRLTPFTSQARVHTLVVPLSSEVSGTIISVDVKNNQLVEAGQTLFQIDPESYQFAVDKAEADLQSAREATGASTANVDVARAQLVTAIANRDKAKKDRDRYRRIQQEDPGAISVRRIESAEASYTSAEGKVDAAKANIIVAQESLGLSGEDNSRILQAQTALDQAKLNLEKTTVKASESGFVTDVRVDVGNFAAAGAPQLTFIATHNVWVQADFTENNLGHIRSGDEALIVFDVLPGEVFSGSIREVGLGVALESTPLGSLPTIDNNRDWLRSAQRYPVLVDFPIPRREDGRTQLRVGSQATVIVLTGDNPIFNVIAKFQIWLDSVLTYAY
jgi:multidrug resistance efflux pump